jgi:hypothetical protein
MVLKMNRNMQKCKYFILVDVEGLRLDKIEVFCDPKKGKICVIELTCRKVLKSSIRRTQIRCNELNCLHVEAPQVWYYWKTREKTRHFCANTDIPLKKYKMAIETKRLHIFIVAAIVKLAYIFST